MVTVNWIPLVWTFGLLINFLLLTHLLLRPKLWSTINTYTSLILSLNVIYLLYLLIINDEEIALEDEPFINALDQMYEDQYRSISCSTSYMFSYMHISLYLYIILGIIFIRSMMIKRAPDICLQKSKCKKHQAHLASIGLIVGIVIPAAAFGITILFILLPRFPFDFILVLHCRGIPFSFSDEEMKKIVSSWLARFMWMIVLVWATISCHVRVIRFKRSHNKSYIKKVRQNINTFQEMLLTAYLLEFGAIVKEVYFIQLVHSKATFINASTLDDAIDIIFCVLLPCYWVYSTKKDFAEFWSSKYLFWTKPETRKGIENTFSRNPLEPRPTLSYKQNIEEEDQNFGRFSYNISLKTPSSSPSTVKELPLKTSSLDSLSLVSQLSSKSSNNIDFPKISFVTPCLESIQTPPSLKQEIAGSTSSEFSFPITPSPSFEELGFLGV